MNQLDVVRARWASFRNHRLQPFAAQYMKNLAKPTYICFKLSERCNSKCIHCDIWENKTEDPLTTDQWIRTLDNIRQWIGPTRVVFTGGEAFLRHDTMEIIRHACRLGLVCEVLTNGILAHRERCEELVRANVDQVTMSLDGVTPETHFAVRRVPGMHEKIVRAIDDLDEFRRIYKSNLKILLKMVIMKVNLHEVVAMADWVHERGQAQVHFQPIEQNYAQEENLDWFKTSDTWISDLDSIKTIVQELVSRKETGYPIHNSVEHLQSMSHYFEKPELLMRKVQSHNWSNPSDMCLAGVSNLVISSNGDARWCAKMPPAGNVKEHTPQELWNNRQECWKTDCGYRA